ncbi:MAG TPA: alpha-L-fucosidase [Candidatus Acidoferrales bacterium]|nr:alpha-L-fucosidase [Candidatus Acidoferrales bacterium]
MDKKKISRRTLLRQSGATLAAAAAIPLSSAIFADAQQPSSTLAGVQSAAPPGQNGQEEQAAEAASRARRMQWWHAAKFGMFIHWGVYSTIERHEWVMENEAIPIEEYMAHAKLFKPKPNAPRAWARLAREAGQRYMVMTTKHHEGFCNFNTQHTTYCAPKQGPGRDLVHEYVEAARAEGLRVGFYYSLMDWHHPDGARCETDEDARKRFVEYTHGLIHDIMSNYGKIDVLWYDVAWPLNADQWESERMNQMVFQLQPDIIVNNRNKLLGDFSTPEQHVQAAEAGRAWETCMTLNDSWGYQAADDNWKSAKTVIRNLVSCVRDGGNYLLNIGPKPDGSVPEPEVNVLREVGQWMKRNGQTIYESDLCQVRRSSYATFTRTGNTLYMHVYFWPGDYVAISGLMTGVKSARLLGDGRKVNFTQNRFQVKLVGLPREAPDHPVTTIALECESEPIQDTLFVRRNKPRDGV